MSDRHRLDLPNLIPDLNEYTLVILRDYDHPQREEYAHQVTQSAHAHGHLCFIAANIQLAKTVGADGLHLPKWRPYHPSYRRIPCSVSVHNAREARRANRIDASLAIISPLYPTPSHPGARHLGPYRFLQLARFLSMPCYALGGIKKNTPLPRVISPYCEGIAGISCHT